VLGTILSEGRRRRAIQGEHPWKQEQSAVVDQPARVA
jgi:hypothetical protein